MSKADRLFAMRANKMVMGKNFEYKDPDDYIYASLSQPPIKVVKKYGDDGLGCGVPKLPQGGELWATYLYGNRTNLLR